MGRRALTESERHASLRRRCTAYVQTQQQAGRLPTFRELARRYRLSLDEVEALVEDTEGLEIVVGAQVGGGGGQFVFGTQGEWEVEYVEYGSA